MRKSLILLIVLLLASGIFTSYCAGQLYELRDQVAVTEKTILGDPSYADGLRYNLKTTYDNHLFWTTAQTLGSGQEPATEYEFRQSSGSRSYTYGGNGGIEYFVNYDVDPLDFSDIPAEFELEGLDKAYKELYDATPDGQKGSKEIRLADYLDFYPMRASISLMGHGCTLENHYDSASYDRYFSGPKDAKYIFNDYFRIPVLEDETLTITLSKEHTGHTTSWGESPGDGDWYYPETFCVVTDDTCYFTFSLRSQLKGVPVDTSHLELGYGLYRFNYSPVHDESFGYEYAVIDPYSLCNAYPLDPASRVLQLGESADKTALHLLTEENGGVYFTAIAQENMETIARFRLADVDEMSYSASMTYTEEFAAVFMHSLEKVAVISISDDGQYTLEFVADYIPDADRNLPLTPNVLAFDGKRLAIANTEYEYFDSNHYFAGFLLIIVDEDGVQYYGEYNTSLNTGRHADNSSYRYNVRHVDDESLVLEWVA